MICKEVDEYISIVRSGEYPVCRDQLLLCDKIENAFDTEDIYVNTDQLGRYLDKQRFFSFRLLPWEKFVFTLHNCTYRYDGLLRWPVLVLYLGRGAGKNGYMAFEDFCLITPVNGVKEYNVDIFATSEKQAKTSFQDVYNVLEDNKQKLGRFFYWNTEVIRNLKTKSELRYHTSGAKTKDGGRPGAVNFDEYHAYEDYRLINVCKTGLGKKEFPRQTIATTDGDVRGGPLDDLKVHMDDILQRGMADNGTLPFICRLDDKSEVDNPKMWHKANPSLRYFKTLRQEIELEYSDYKINPVGNSSFVVKRMNLPNTFEKQSVTDWANILACRKKLPDLEWCDCVAGIDYAKTTDFVAAGLLFKHMGIYYWMQHTWICKKSADLPKIKAPLRDWADAGYITYVDGPEIPPELPAEWLQDKGHEYNITKLGIDNFRFTLMARALREAGFDCDKGGACNIMLTKRVTQNRYVPVITSLFNTHMIGWGDDPMMGWYTYNTCIEEDRGNQYYGKKDPERRKTDGFMALVSAICSAADLKDSGEETDLDEFQVFSF